MWGVKLSEYTSYNLKTDFKRTLFAMSKYKFALKLLKSKNTILEVGCNDGFLTQMFAGEFEKIDGIDFDEKSITYAKNTFETENMKFIYGDFFEYVNSYKYDAIVSFDVIEHIEKSLENKFIKKTSDLLNKDGVLVLSTPNITASDYQGEASRIGHVNLYSYDRFYDLLNKYFNNVFLFSANDEIIHTGFYPMAHHLMGVCVSPKSL